MWLRLLWKVIMQLWTCRSFSEPFGGLVTNSVRREMRNIYCLARKKNPAPLPPPLSLSSSCLPLFSPLCSPPHSSFHPSSAPSSLLPGGNLSGPPACVCVRERVSTELCDPIKVYATVCWPSAIFFGWKKGCVVTAWRDCESHTWTEHVYVFHASLFLIAWLGMSVCAVSWPHNYIPLHLTFLLIHSIQSPCLPGFLQGNVHCVFCVYVCVCIMASVIWPSHTQHSVRHWVQASLRLKTTTEAYFCVCARE